jgi:predicted DNA-binding transcriptional regulator AlpA
MSIGKQLKHKRLYGMSEAVEALGVPRSTINRWRGNGTMPSPYEELASGPVWKREDIEKFIRQRERAEERAAQVAA